MSQMLQLMLMSAGEEGGSGGRIGLMLFDVLKPVRSLAAAFSQGDQLVMTDSCGGVSAVQPGENQPDAEHKNMEEARY